LRLQDIARLPSIAQLALWLASLAV
jgi:hypothetical protein